MQISDVQGCAEVWVCQTLPLAVYREVAAHLRQVDGVKVELLPQRSLVFEYTQSQIGGIKLEYPQGLLPENRIRVQRILAYYSDRYGAWEPLNLD